MSQENTIKNNVAVPRQQIRIRLDQFKRARQLSPVGTAELAGLGVALLLALVTVFAYFYLLLPAGLHLNAVQLDRERLKGQVAAAQAALAEGTNTKDRVDKITASIDAFQEHKLMAASSGRMALYTELNDLMRSNAVRNTSGPSYTALEAAGSKTQPQQTTPGSEKQNNAKWESVYPGIAVGVTVEGTYQNVRRFVRDIELSRHFLIINAIELEGVSQSGAPQEMPAVQTTMAPRTGRTTGVGSAPPTAPAPPAPKGSLVSLRLDMTIYFQREPAEGDAPPNKLR
jgi:hypothetical protein